MPLSRQEDVAAAKRQLFNASLLPNQPQPQRQQQQQQPQQQQQEQHQPLRNEAEAEQAGQVVDSSVQADNVNQCELQAFMSPGEQSGSGGIAAARTVSKAGQVQQPRARNTIIIHVKDDARKMSKDFPCDRGILLQHMRYFERFLQREDSADDVDISVHCDMAIFDWLVRHIHQRPPKAVLSEKIVTSILISSNFLGIRLLVQRCSEYIWQHLPAVLATGIELASIDMELLSGIASYADVERFASRFDPQNKLLEVIARCKLQTFSEQNEQKGLLRKCLNCGIVLSAELSRESECRSAAVEVDARGELVARHVEDNEWRLQGQIEEWICDRWSWQEIFWRLWGGCFWVRCQFAPSPLPLAQLRPRFDRLLVIGGEGLREEQEFEPVEPCSEAGVSRAQFGQTKTMDPNAPRHLHGTHDNACATQGHVVRVVEGTSSCSRAKAWMTFKGKQIHNVPPEQVRHESRVVTKRGEAVTQRGHTDSFSHESSEASSDSDMSDGNTKPLAGRSSTFETASAGGGAMLQSVDIEVRASGVQWCLSGIVTRDFIDAEIDFFAIHAGSSKFPSITENVADANKERIRKWRKDFRYKHDSDFMVALSRSLLNKRSDHATL